MNSSKTTWIALVALADEVLPDAEAVLAALAEQGGAADQCGDSSPQIASRTNAMVTLQWGEATAAYTLIDRPIPQPQLAGPCEAAWYWPSAAKELADHRAHLLITLVDEGRDAIEKSMRLTALTTGAATCGPARGIVWGPAGIVHEPAAFVEQAGQSSLDNLPLYLWIDFRVEETEPGRHRIFTTGMVAFGRRELEVIDCDAPPQQLLSDVYNVAHYAIEHASQIKDADTIGLPDDRQMVAHHAASQLGDDRQVVQLSYG